MIKYKLEVRKMADKKKDSKNMIFVSLFIGTMLLFMLGTVIYVTSQVANCSSAKKARNLCYSDKKLIEKGEIFV